MLRKLIRRVRANLGARLAAVRDPGLTRRLTVGDKSLRLLLGDTHHNMAYAFPPGSVYEPWVGKYLRIVAEYVGEDKSAVDVGANMGIISLSLAALLPGGVVFAFEPSRVMYEHLLLNITNNAITNINAEPFALTATAGEDLHVNIAKNSEAGGSFISPADKPANMAGTYAVPIESTSLDAYLKRVRPSPDIKILKLDVEGWETAVLSGATETMARHDPVTFLEFNVADRTMRTEERGRALHEKARSLFSNIYLINRLDEKLYPISCYGELRACMLTGHFVEDLLCFNDPDLRVRLKDEIETTRFTTYGAAVVKRERESGTFTACLSQYPDDWCHGHDFALIASRGRAGTLRLTLDNAGPHEKNRVLIIHGDSAGTHVLDRESLRLDFAVHRDQDQFLHVFVEKTFQAREFFGNDDPRELGIRIGVEWI